MATKRRRRVINTGGQTSINTNILGEAVNEKARYQDLM
jgi:hypothetical protein